MAELSPQCTTFPLTADIQEQKVTFVICALERMPSEMSILKELLIKTLFSLASKSTDCMFSIISCANQVLKWQNALVKCSLASVAEAAAWIRTLKCDRGASVLSAVAAALEDSSCQAIYLFTNGLCECAAEEICALLKEKTGQACPLHMVYLVQNRGENTSSLQEILEKIAKESGGSFQRISFSSDETEDQINPGDMANVHRPDCISKRCCAFSHPTGPHATACSPLGVWSLDSPHVLLSNSAKEDFKGWHTRINDLQRGIRVLARKKTDGHFYRGHIVQHVELLCDLFKNTSGALLDQSSGPPNSAPRLLTAPGEAHKQGTEAKDFNGYNRVIPWAEGLLPVEHNSLTSPLPLHPKMPPKLLLWNKRPAWRSTPEGVLVCSRKVKGSKGHVLIEFERSRKSPQVKAEFRMQETPLYDVVHREDGRWQPVAAGDRVLAPWEKKGRRYGPGTALQVTETGSPHSAFQNSKVLVSFWNGQTKAVPADTVVKIPLPLCERIILELQMPSAARQMLVEQNPHYPYTVPPGYRASGSCRQSHLDCICWSDASQVPCVSTTCSSTHHVPLWHFCYPAWERIRSPVTSAQPEDALIPGNNMTKEELNRKIEEQLSRGRRTVLEGSENEESRKPKEEKNAEDLKPWKESESKLTTPSKTHQESASEDSREGAGTTVDVAINTDKCTPWQEQKVFPQPNMKETSALPFHQSPPRKLFIARSPQVHATFVWVDKSLKEDSSAIESVLHMRRSHSAPAIQRLPMTATAASPDSPREAVRMEFRRQKWEQRRLKEEQKQEEECIQKELLRDTRRQRSLQRSLQGSQKQQENTEQAWWRLGHLQVAREERTRQESCLREEEKNKESQRLEFLKAQRKRRDQQLTEHNQGVDAQENKRLELLKNRMQSVQKNLKAAGQGEDTKENKVAAKLRDFQKRDLISRQAEKKRRETQDLQQYLREQSLLMLRASLLS